MSSFASSHLLDGRARAMFQLQEAETRNIHPCYSVRRENGVFPLRMAATCFFFFFFEEGGL